MVEQCWPPAGVWAAAAPRIWGFRGAIVPRRKFEKGGLQDANLGVERGRQWFGARSEQYSIWVICNLITALKACSKDLFPNIHVLLQLACLMPITSCEAERSFSVVRRTKTALRSTMGEDRLSALVLLNSNRSLHINVEDVIHRFIVNNPRPLFSTLYSK